MRDPTYDLAFVLWRFQMWLEGYGTYEEIAWAVEHHILRPLHVPGKIWGSFARWMIRRYHHESIRLSEIQARRQ